MDDIDLYEKINQRLLELSYASFMEDGSEIDAESEKAFQKFIEVLGVKRKPMLSLTPDNEVCAVWETDQRDWHVSITFRNYVSNLLIRKRIK